MRLLYPITIFLSAFLLFQVQPIITKIILPWFGGGAAIWNVCLLFFQTALLLGYFYAFLINRLPSIKHQKRVHITLLLVSLILLPIYPRDALKPTTGGDPTWHILLVLAVTVGIPYFLLSTTGPLLQAWYARRQTPEGEASVSPYHLYALSNLGSMLALISYPFLVEPLLTLRWQAWSWSIFYGGFVLLCGGIAWKLKTSDLMRQQTIETHAIETHDNPINDKRPNPGSYILWASLSAISTTLLLAITTHLSHDVAAVPFLWILPLSLYLLSFIIVFASKTFTWSRASYPFPAIGIAALVFAISSLSPTLDVIVLIPLFSFGLFVCCLLCHGELARIKPSPRYLTDFYLMISLGGAIGGIFVGLIAPRIFPGYYELPIAIIACSFVAVFLYYREPVIRWTDFSWFALVTCVTAMSLLLANDTLKSTQRYEISKRDFYGVLRVFDEDFPKRRTLVNGTIKHGVQLLEKKRRLERISYYSEDSGVHLAVELLPEDPVRIGVIGLGTGTMAAFGKKGDLVKFYEINPLDVQIANTHFYFLSETPAKTEIVLGDARVSMEREPLQNYDLLVIDAFSSDAIPVHLLTKEAMELYFRHLKPDGILAVHISNRYLALEPVVAEASVALGKIARRIDNGASEDETINASSWVLMTSKKGLIDAKKYQGICEPLKRKSKFRMWTDDYSNLFDILITK